MTTKKSAAAKKFVTDQNGKQLVPGDFVITQKADGFPTWNGDISQIQKVETIHHRGTKGVPLRMAKRGLVKAGKFLLDGVSLNVQAKFINSVEEDSRITGCGYFPSQDCVKVKLTADDKLAWSQDYE
jgi:hypothetical protein